MFLLFVFCWLQLHIEVHSDPTSPTSKEEDFFQEHTKDDVQETTAIEAEQKLCAPIPVKNGALSGTGQGE